MRTPIEVYQRPTTGICACGRSRYTRHCPDCASISYFALKSAEEVFSASDKVLLVKGFRCRKCGNAYNDMTECKAPSLEQKIAERSRAAKLGEVAKLPPVELRQGLDIVLKHRQERHEKAIQDGEAKPCPQCERLMKRGGPLDDKFECVFCGIIEDAAMPPRAQG